MKKKEGVKINVAYPLALLGDLNLSLLLTASVFYGRNSLGASPSDIGLIGGAYGLSYFLMAALLGWLGDKMSRKLSLIFALIGQLSVILYILFQVSSIIESGIIELIVSMFIMGIFYGFFWPALEAFISENTKKNHAMHQIAISNFCISWGIGLMIGPLLAGIFSENDIKITFITLLVSYSIAFVLILIFLPVKRNENSINKSTFLKKGNEKRGIIKRQGITENTVNTENTEDKKNKKIKSFTEAKFLLLVLLTVLTYAMLTKVLLTFFADYAGRTDGLNWTDNITGQILFVFGFGRTLYFLSARIFQKYFQSSIKRINFSILIIGVLLFLMTFIRFLAVISIFFFIMGIGNGLIYMSSLDLLMRYEEKAKGTKAGMFEGFIGLGSAGAPIIA
ncbi:MAG: MFS transporter, partial [Promethearchaeota archaeon]